jgi:5-methylcytosine-specific restriction protein A
MFIKGKSVYISAIVFISTIIYSWIMKKPSLYKNNYNFNTIPTKKTMRNVSPLTKKIVASNQKWLCGNCKKMLDFTYEIDHKVPLFQGGSNDYNNLIALCRDCHGRKTILERL